ncbi:hypothetical protein DVK05_06195 [Halorubrum sp. Atlit-8R]|uniref:hypothetical protein n=1 Tax=unclassified Halorubrum TaxID=2642239 RepID=UPI000EF1F969|nr:MULTISPECIES: hypothetical protein [unclassified Halorubrum]RLM66820.1 hypothetical protein DVK08_13215 [Halorubrum sp. Atlit-9R]RLM81643.1 hypothetical protein DVK05_06195 [Halorubrum sp. Atlit-8R]
MTVGELSLSIGLLLFGAFLVYFGSVAVLRPDGSFSRGYKTKEQVESAGPIAQAVVKGLVRVLGVAFIAVGLLTGGLGLLGVSAVW